jgi:hypothetical protein
MSDIIWPPKEQVMLKPVAVQGKLVYLQGYARTSTGIPVAAPKIVFSSPNPWIAIDQTGLATATFSIPTNIIRNLVWSTTPDNNTSGSFPVTCSGVWTTKGGKLTASTVLYLIDA